MARILVVEDNPANMKLAVLLLTQAGHETLQAADAETALRLVRDRQPHLVLMDVQLPGMDGLAATRLLKSQADTCGIKIIALTALAMPGDRERIQAAGCDGYIAKPIRYKEFLREVATALGAEPAVQDA